MDTNIDVRRLVCNKCIAHTIAYHIDKCCVFPIYHVKSRMSGLLVHLFAKQLQVAGGKVKVVTDDSDFVTKQQYLSSNDTIVIVVGNTNKGMLSNSSMALEVEPDHIDDIVQFLHGNSKEYGLVFTLSDLYFLFLYMNHLSNSIQLLKLIFKQKGCISLKRYLGVEHDTLFALKNASKISTTSSVVIRDIFFHCQQLFYDIKAEYMNQKLINYIGKHFVVTKLYHYLCRNIDSDPYITLANIYTCKSDVAAPEVQNTTIPKIKVDKKGLAVAPITLPDPLYVHDKTPPLQDEDATSVAAIVNKTDLRDSTKHLLVERLHKVESEQLSDNTVILYTSKYSYVQKYIDKIKSSNDNLLIYIVKEGPHHIRNYNSWLYMLTQIVNTGEFQSHVVMSSLLDVNLIEMLFSCQVTLRDRQVILDNVPQDWGNTIRKEIEVLMGTFLSKWGVAKLSVPMLSLQEYDYNKLLQSCNIPYDNNKAPIAEDKDLLIPLSIMKPILTIKDRVKHQSKIDQELEKACITDGSIRILLAHEYDSYKKITKSSNKTHNYYSLLKPLLDFGFELEEVQTNDNVVFKQDQKIEPKNI